VSPDRDNEYHAYLRKRAYARDWYTKGYRCDAGRYYAAVLDGGSLLSLGGGSTGMVIGLLFTISAVTLLSKQIGEMTVPYALIVSISLTFSILVGTVFGSYPAIRAARMDQSKRCGHEHVIRARPSIVERRQSATASGSSIIVAPEPSTIFPQSHKEGIVPARSLVTRATTFDEPAIVAGSIRRRTKRIVSTTCVTPLAVAGSDMRRLASVTSASLILVSAHHQAYLLTQIVVVGKQTTMLRGAMRLRR